MSAISLSWIFLIFAGLAEVLWSYYLKQSDGFSKLWPSVFFALALLLSMTLLALSLRSLPLSLAYPVWTGIGAVGAVLVGYAFFNEGLGNYRLLFVSLILIGVIGLKVVE
ncbi:MAG: SMR family transporter [Bdellovibrionota bacterium]